MYKLVVVTPERKVFEGEVKSIVVRTVVGDIGVLAGHASYVAPIDTGRLNVVSENGSKLAAVSGGFVRVAKNQTTILTNTCEWADEIDVERAKTAQEKAEKRINSKHGDIDVAELKLKRALNRIDVAGDKK